MGLEFPDMIPKLKPKSQDHESDPHLPRTLNPKPYRLEKQHGAQRTAGHPQGEGRIQSRPRA